LLNLKLDQVRKIRQDDVERNTPRLWPYVLLYWLLR